jgi:predicted RND superfamily exporter protein
MASMAAAVVAVVYRNASAGVAATLPVLPQMTVQQLYIRGALLIKACI